MKKILLAAIIISTMISCKTEPKSDDTAKKDTQAFLDSYTETYQKLYYASSEAEWASNTHIIEGDTLNSYNVQKANGALATFTGSKDVIEKTRGFLEFKNDLDLIQIRQLEGILYAAAGNPEIASEIVKQKIAAETKQVETLYGYDFKVDGTSVSTGDIDEVLRHSINEDERLKHWEASKEVGVGLKDGLENLVSLRNQTVQALGYDDYFSYQVSNYGMTRGEMMVEMKKMVQEVWPLYRELHTWARYNLADKFKEDVPEYLPAHWLPNRWGQNWDYMVTVEGLDVDGALQSKTPEWMVKEGEDFFVSIGFDPLPQSFYDKSSLYPVAKDAGYKKNNHASAWHMDLKNDLRSLMSVDLSSYYYKTVHHELGHIYYFQSYSIPETPILLREGANRGYHEAFGEMLGFAAMQKPFLAAKGLVDADAEVDQTQTMLKEALKYVVFLPFSAGVMSEFENSLYAENLPKDEYNKKWWELAKKYQGMVPPSERGEEYCDASSKTHINNDAAQYYDYAISFILLFQFHDHIAKNILHQDPHATNYFGNKEIGDFMNGIMKQGANCDWNEVLKDNLGSGMSAKPMLEYFDPLMDYLKEQNKGREHTLPETI